MKFADWLLQNPPPDFAAFLARHRESHEDGVWLVIPAEAWAAWEVEVKAWRERYRYRHEERQAGQSSQSSQ